MFNNLISFNDVIKSKTCEDIRQRFNYNDRDLVRPHNKNPQAILDTINEHYKSKESGLYTELVRQLHSIIIGEEGIRQYEKNFRKINVEIIQLNISLRLSQLYIIQLFLIDLDDPYDVFITTYTQTHMLYDTGAVKFDEVTKSAINEEHHMLSSDSETVILAYRPKNKAKEKDKSIHSHNNSEHNRETYDLCKAADRKYRHPSAKC